MIKIAPSLLGADIFDLSNQIKEIENCGIEMLHIDMMDGNFVPNIAFGPDQIKMIRNESNLILDVHMMVEAPERYIHKVAEAGADIISIHVESTNHIHRCIQLIKDEGKKAGVVLNPGTSIKAIEEIIDDIDMVLLMTVDPGYGGQKFIPNITKKIENVRECIGFRNIDLEIDGGINADNLHACIEAGANVIVAGSFVFRDSITDNISKLNSIINKMGGLA